jgi:Mn2+/Fe2+ NRAMP family transporter
LFEKTMGVCVGVMFAVVVMTAIALGPPPADVVRGLVVPQIPAGGAPWTLAIIGGIGGTVTVLCYGYWIREEGRASAADLADCRVDLALGYVVTAIFGLAMVIIGSSLRPMTGGGALLLATIAGELQAALGGAGPLAKWAFLIGAWAAIFSSLLGVWQSVPYLFADLWSLLHPRSPRPARVDTRALPYQLYLVSIAVVPVAGLAAVNFRSMQKTYAIVGALFIPMLAVVLLALNGRASVIGSRYRNSLVTTLVLVAALGFFVVVAGQEVYEQLFAE